MNVLRPKSETRRRRRPLGIILTLVLIALFAVSGCKDGTGISVASDSPDSGCARVTPPHSYTIYFILDVSGSMGLFLTGLSRELQTFIENFPEYDDEGERVRIDFYVIGFVNDIKHFGGGRMTSAIALQDAFEQAIEEGSTDYNLNVRSFNAEREENLLDALGQISTIDSDSEAQMVMIATDAPFVEYPNLLNEGIQVQNTYAGILEMLTNMDARIHAFTPRAMDGITRTFMKQDALTSLPGSSIHRLDSLTGAGTKIRETLGLIARNASCQ
jgi:hypothetical protein